MKQRCIFALAVCLIVKSLVLSAPEAIGDTKCSKEALHKFRVEQFKKLIDRKEFLTAAEQMETFLETNACSEELVDPIFPDEGAKFNELALAGAREFLWATSDLSFAYLKADRPGKCLEITESELNKYYQNPLNTVDSKELTKAFETNSKLCLKRRESMFPIITHKGCQLDQLPKELSLSSDFGAGAGLYKVEKVLDSIQLPNTSGFDCLAVLRVANLRGIISDMCSSIEECKKSGSPDDMEQASISQLVGVKGDSVVVLDYMSDLGWCGEPEISLHSEDPAILAKSVPIVRVKADVAPCLMLGTGRASVDSYFYVTGGKLEVRDGSIPGYH